MPSTVIPSAILPRMSETAGCWSASSFARAPDRRREQHLPAGRGPQAVLGGAGRALVRDLEDADLLDRVAEELDPQRVLLGRREHVEQPAPDRQLAALADHLDPRVADLHQPGDHVLGIGVVADDEPHRLEVAEPGHDRLQHRPHRRDDHPERARRARPRPRRGARAAAAPRSAARRCPSGARAAHAAASPSRGTSRPSAAAGTRRARRSGPPPPARSRSPRARSAPGRPGPRCRPRARRPAAAAGRTARRGHARPRRACQGWRARYGAGDLRLRQRAVQQGSWFPNVGYAGFPGTAGAAHPQAAPGHTNPRVPPDRGAPWLTFGRTPRPLSVYVPAVRAPATARRDWPRERDLRVVWHPRRHPPRRSRHAR